MFFDRLSGTISHILKFTVRRNKRGISSCKGGVWNFKSSLRAAQPERIGDGVCKRGVAGT
ncbi:hypothetical protein CAMGR0001_1375 [Campylobacter gracilis RM3268]|uniref:Uncharacterized protein n=1 Tax=Campylobacter gracilis RM3268 TaxID=553220 RepID=C8PJH5_9BACT|nr:hypothetical protein CAMGR0001_1375 [Campylobacter gracilis RM3268]